ncbi:MAG: hypothetical protein KDD94_01190 [Calditrichaeota bacterium]|nr:hypothetical protein [Calditrichota bacterium]
MKINVIKKLSETAQLEDLIKAEEDLLEGRVLEIEVEGEDEGEQLTHVYAAKWILEKVKTDGVDLRTALREYTVKVRKSIG